MFSMLWAWMVFALEMSKMVITVHICIFNVIKSLTGQCVLCREIDGRFSDQVSAAVRQEKLQIYRLNDIPFNMRH